MIAEIDTLCGRLWISGDEENIFEVSWDIIQGSPHGGELDWILCALDAYFSGKLTRFPGMLTFFGRQPVWTRAANISPPRRVSDNALLAVSRIPFGRVSAYGDIARDLGNPRLARAVGQACKNNPIPVIVPCHRVVARNSLGGFSSGLIRKEILLAHEGVPLAGIRA
jgi:O-6-methylguanine DNA methyltransferase